MKSRNNGLDYAINFIMKEAGLDYLEGTGGTPIIMCQNECKLTYEEIKEEIVSPLQSRYF